MSTERIINELIDISKNKYRLLQILLGIEKKINQSLQSLMPRSVIKQMEIKDKYITEANNQDVKFYTCFNELKTNLGVDSLEKVDGTKYPRMKELKKIIGEILNVVGEIEIISSENSKIFKSNMDKMGNELRGIKQGKKAANAYKAHKKLSNPQKSYEKK
ncbi:flagellar export chaperone FlgN [Wukongibacter baidiensis]|uniref:flagellar export chaperone FlgN n=1 Tax=Wukongibacter baidiensis TaxID=1723361 RepID=UPI003D7FFAA3